MKKLVFAALVLCISSLPLIYLSMIWAQLPATVPTHFGFDGKADGFGDKKSLLYLVLVMCLVGAGSYFLLTNLHKIDPKKGAKFSQNALNKMALAMLFFFAIIGFLMVYSALEGRLQLHGLFLPALGLFFAYLGNLIHSIKQNYFVGIRTPWALENEETWRKTHQLGGKLWFAGGIIITISALLVPAPYASIITLVIIAVIVIIPVVFSYVFFQRVKNS